MKFLVKLIIIFCAVNSAFAGFGRGGSSGGRSYSSSSYSRSYSAPSRSYSAPQRTVVYRNTTSVVHHDSGGGGMHPLVAGMAGYMLGNALANNNQVVQSAPAPQVVYVNSQPQQAAPIQQPDAPQIIQQVPAQPVSLGHGFFFYFFLAVTFSLCCAFLIKLMKIETRCD